jgi:uncharacterized cupredoxin-like copper-binding protein
MKVSLLTIIAVALSLGVVWAEGPVEKAKDVAEDTAETAKDVGHKVVKGTKKVVNKVVDAVTPDPDARRVDVTLSDDKIDMPTSLETGKTAFVVKNVGNEKHNFVVRGKDGTHKFMVDLQPNETKVLHVQLKRGTYTAYAPLDGHPKKGTETTLTVKS